MSDKTQATAAVLDEMVAGIMGVKAEKATRLTPVGLEGVRAAPVSNQFAPMESPYGGLQAACARIRENMALIDKYLTAVERDALDIASGRSAAAPTTRTPDALDEAWGTTPTAEEPFAERMKRLADEAQASLSTSLPSGSWACKTHGSEDVRTLTSPRGREYRACGVPNCKEFEKR